MKVKGRFSLKITHLVSYMVSILAYLCFQTYCFAAVVLHGNQVINTATTYNNTDLDLTDGRFTINTGGTLTIQNSTITMTISPTNPFLIQMNDGNLNFNNNKVIVKVSNIAQTPNTDALYRLINVTKGGVNITTNTFNIDTPYTVGLFLTQNNVTSGYKINQNIINNFHGGIYLMNSNNAEVNGNEFTNVSFSNIFYSGNLSKFMRNIFSFPGNLQLGNAIDIVNSEGLTISHNVITSGSNYGISIIGGNKIFIEHNKITDGKSYAIIILTPESSLIRNNKYLSQLLPGKKQKFNQNSNISITNNYIAQNKYGLTSGAINTLIVTKNTFIQRFKDTSTRQYWTNNDNLLAGVVNLIWNDNIYKEAFTQDISGDNTPSLQFVNFPSHGGVFIN